MIPEHIEALIIDMDGVLWKTDSPIGDLAAIFKRIRNRGWKFVFATNNSSKTPGQYVEKLAQYGVEVEPEQVITSSRAAAQAVAQKFPFGTKVFVIGEDGIQKALEEKGFEVVTFEFAPQAEVFVMGLDHRINFDKVSEATLLVRKGVPFYATNADKTLPTPRGEVPGAGALISIITTATGIEPIVVGKPFPFLMEIAMQKMGTSIKNTLVIGDRLETDIAAGQTMGCPCALVLSGVSTRDQASAWNPKVDIIAEDLTQLIG